eukprot:COSAG05_NODE_5196_length_1239_cov_3.088596_1_plen_164_part_10
MALQGAQKATRGAASLASQVTPDQLATALYFGAPAAALATGGLSLPTTAALYGMQAFNAETVGDVYGQVASQVPDYHLNTPIATQVGDAGGASMDAFFTAGRDYIAPGMQNLASGLLQVATPAVLGHLASAATAATSYLPALPGYGDPLALPPVGDSDEFLRYG